VATRRSVVVLVSAPLPAPVFVVPDPGASATWPIRGGTADTWRYAQPFAPETYIV